MLNMQLLVLACNKSQPIDSGGEEQDLLWKYQDSVVFRIALVAGRINKVRPEERAVGLTVLKFNTVKTLFAQLRFRLPPIAFWFLSLE